jgi:hypothetical protein
MNDLQEVDREEVADLLNIIKKELSSANFDFLSAKRKPGGYCPKGGTSKLEEGRHF